MLFFFETLLVALVTIWAVSTESELVKGFEGGREAL
jgi:hypothetical protein